MSCEKCKAKAKTNKQKKPRQRKEHTGAVKLAKHAVDVPLGDRIVYLVTAEHNANKAEQISRFFTTESRLRSQVN